MRVLKGKWPVVWGGAMALALAGVLAYPVLTSETRQEHKRLTQEAVRLRQEIASLETANDGFRASLSSSSERRRAIERSARADLAMVRPNERMYIVVSP